MNEFNGGKFSSKIKTPRLKVPVREVSQPLHRIYVGKDVTRNMLMLNISGNNLFSCLVVFKSLDSQSRGPVFNTNFHHYLAFHP